jgi:hypothetical protein
MELFFIAAVLLVPLAMAVGGIGLIVGAMQSIKNTLEK